MSLIANGAGESAKSFYNGVATQSLRLDNSAGSLLTRTPSAGNRKTWTWSAWIKRNDIGRDQDLFTAEGSGAQLFAIQIVDTNKIQIYGVNAVLLQTTQQLRDLSAWYHVVIKSDTTQGTASNRLKIYLNGSEVTSFATDNRATYAQNTDYGINSGVKHNIGSNQAGGNFGDFYIAEVNFVDGTAYDASHFGETKNGVWIPKQFTGTYGTQGFHLEFKEGGDGSSTASSSTIGADTANSNHYKDTNLDAYDSNMPDSPENNFSTWNALFRGGEQSASIAATSTLLNGNLEVSVPTNSYMGNTFRPVSGKWYCEFRVKTLGDARGELDWGWFQATTYAGTTAHAGQANKWGAYYHAYSTAHIQVYDEASQLGSNINLTIAAGAVLQLAWDIDSNKGWLGINNTYYAADNGTDGNPSTGANQTFTFTADEAQNLQCYVGNGLSTDVFVANFGQDSTFGGDETATSNADANGIGAFHHAPPTGFLALCTANLPETTIGPNSDSQATDYFETVLYTGNSTDDTTVAVNFAPDWVWLKSRFTSGGSIHSHFQFDTNRGATNFFKPDTNAQAADDAATLKAFTSTGFTLGNSDVINDTGTSYVAWNWKAGNAPTATNSAGVGATPTANSVKIDGANLGSALAGSIMATKISASTKAGFSVVTYTGTGTAGTVAHGLGTIPQWYIVRCLDNSSSSDLWYVYHSGVGANAEDSEIYLNLTDGASFDVNKPFNEIKPTASVFSIKTLADVNQNGKLYIAYCFSDRKGFSQFGSYIGTGVAAGTFIYLGFKPAWIMTKETSADGEDWIMWDNKRDTNNPNNVKLFANSTGEETVDTDTRMVDFLSNGFKLRTAHDSHNGSQTTHIYMAFAEAPFKYANAK